MNYYFCSSCDKRIELKYKQSHLKSELQMKTEGTVFNKYTIINSELCEINNIIKNNIHIYDKRFEFYKIICRWKLVFDDDTSFDGKSKVMHRVSVFCNNNVKYLKKKIIFFRRQGLQFTYIAEMNFTFITSLNFMTYKHYNEQPMPMVERLVNRKLYKNYELLKTLDDIDLTYTRELMKMEEMTYMTIQMKVNSYRYSNTNNSIIIFIVVQIFIISVTIE